jgi:hypothetical protein
MLHEILLSLSGHPSALFHAPSQGDAADGVTVADFPLLSPPERALLASVGALSRLHRDLRAHAALVSASHPSAICRAVATAITTLHLARFQKKILDVEEGILKKDAASVGAYNIVPLAGVVAEFDEWTRLMHWFWLLACFMQNPKAKSSTPCCGSALVDRLRQEAQTGYPDIEQAALDLGRVAETAWLRQLSTWVLYGRLPTFGAQDFFIQQINTTPDFELDPALLPKLVSAETASSIMFIGKSLNHIRSRGTDESSMKTGSELDLLPIHLRYLSELVLPISPSALSSAISAIRLSLSRNTLQALLPLPKIIEILTLFREYFLLGRGEFAISLITEANSHLATRNRTSKSSDNLRALVIKETELTNILSKTFSILSSLASDDSEDQESVDMARELLHLNLAKVPSSKSKATGPATFNDLLLPAPTILTSKLPPSFDLFTTSAELSIYSNLHSYLLSIRRAHMALSNLWRQTLLRRTHPAPLGPPLSTSAHGLKLLKTRRERATKRNLDMRAVWATASAAVFLLSEMGSYFEGEVVGGAWADLRTWILGPSEQIDKAEKMEKSLSSLSVSAPTTDHKPIPAESTTDQQTRPHDPESLSQAHRIFLSQLQSSLLLTDKPFTHLLRTLLTQIDALVALLHRLQTIQSSLDLEEDDGVIVDAMVNYEKELLDVVAELDRARKRVDSGLKGIVERLREIDGATGEEDLVGGVKGNREGWGDEKRGGNSGFGGEEYEGWKGGGGVERLLMRLDVHYGDVGDEADDDD